MLIEILFFAHSTIVFGVVGVFLMLASLLWTMIDRYPGQNFFPTGKMFAMPLLNMFIALVGSLIVIALLARYLPRTSIYRRFALMDSNPPGPSLAGVPRQFATAFLSLQECKAPQLQCCDRAAKRVSPITSSTS